MTPPFRHLSLLLLLTVLTVLAACSRSDVAQTEFCERVARLLFGDGAIERIGSTTDAALPHAIVTALTLRRDDGGLEQHRVACSFAGGAFSPRRLDLEAVSPDDAEPLDEVHMVLLRYVLERQERPGTFETLYSRPRFEPAPPALLHLAVGADTLYFLQQLINGLTLGCIIALIAIGYTLVYSIIGAINFSFGELYMIGAFSAVIGIVLLMVLGLGSFVGSMLLALPIAMTLNAGYGWVTERMVFRPLRQANSLMPLIAAIGLSVVLQNYVFVAEGAGDLWLPPIAKEGTVLAEAGGFSLYVNGQQAILGAVTAVLVYATWHLLAKTPFGRAQRASAQDKGMAALVGINIDQVIAGTFALGGALAAAGGLLVATNYGGVNFVMGFVMGFKALTAAIVGGMGNFAGALLGGFIVALVETFWAGYLQIEYKDIAVFSLLVLLLVFRPHGILGER